MFGEQILGRMNIQRSRLSKTAQRRLWVGPRQVLACRRIHRATRRGEIETHRQAAPCGHPDAFRLSRYWPGHSDEPGELRPRTEICREAR